MNQDWTTFNVKYLAVPMTMLVFGIVIGFGISDSTHKHPQKEYPVKVEVCYETKQYWYTKTIECDSLKGDTIYKDGLFVINKNIVNVIFK